MNVIFNGSNQLLFASAHSRCCALKLQIDWYILWWPINRHWDFFLLLSIFVDLGTLKRCIIRQSSLNFSCLQFRVQFRWLARQELSLVCIVVLGILSCSVENWMASWFRRDNKKTWFNWKPLVAQAWIRGVAQIQQCVCVTSWPVVASRFVSSIWTCSCFSRTVEWPAHNFSIESCAWR